MTPKTLVTVEIKEGEAMYEKVESPNGPAGAKFYLSQAEYNGARACLPTPTHWPKPFYTAPIAPGRDFFITRPDIWWLSYGMDHAKEYAEPLIEAVTSLNWSVDHPRHAMKAIQEAILKNTGDHLSNAEALIVVGRLVDRKLIRTRIDPLASHFAESGRPITGRKGKYYRVPEYER